MLDRRGLLQAITGGLAGATVHTVEAKKPILFVLKLDETWGEADHEVINRFQEKWKRLFNGLPPAPLMIIGDGAELSVVAEE